MRKWEILTFFFFIIIIMENDGSRADYWPTFRNIAGEIIPQRPRSKFDYTGNYTGKKKQFPLMKHILPLLPVHGLDDYQEC